jgi:hypothetical protein
VRRAPLVQAAAAVWAGGDLTGQLAAATAFTLRRCRVVLGKASGGLKARLVFDGTAMFPDGGRSALDFTLRLTPVAQAVVQQVGVGGAAANKEPRRRPSRKPGSSTSTSTVSGSSSGSGSGSLDIRSGSSATATRSLVVDALVAADPEVRASLGELTVWGQRLPDLWVPLGSSGVGVGLGPRHVLSSVSGRALGREDASSPPRSPPPPKPQPKDPTGVRGLLATVLNLGKGSPSEGAGDPKDVDIDEEGLLVFQGTLFRNGAQPPAKKQGGFLALPLLP